MQKPPLPEDESARLAALYRLGILHTPREERFDRITRLASRLFNVPIALVSLVAGEEQWFKSSQGLEASSTSRDISFCGHAILEEAVLVVKNAMADQRFADNPLVTNLPGIRFYAGQPIHAPDGSRVGTLCLIDRTPREFSQADVEILRDLAALVDAELHRADLHQLENEMLQSFDLFPGPVFTVNDDGVVSRANRHAAALFGYDDLQGVAVADLIPDQFKAGHGAFVHQFFAHPEPRQMRSGRTFYAKRRDGSIIPVDIALSTMHHSGRAHALATAVDLTEHKKQERDLAYAKRAFQLLSDARNAVLHATDEQALLDKVCAVAARAGAYALAWVGRKENDARKTVEAVAAAGAPEATRDLRRIGITWGDEPLGYGPAGRCITSERPVVVNNIAGEATNLPWLEAASSRGLGAAIALPLRIEGAIYGSLMLGASQPDAFSDQEVDLLKEVASELAFGIEALRHRDARNAAEAELKHLAYSDAVTGLANRARVMEFLAEAFSEGRQGALLCIDFAEFREINDAQGHLVGDALLNEIAHHLSSLAGRDYLLARFTGAEFALLAPSAERADAARLADNVVRTLSAPFAVNGQSFNLHARVGIAFCPHDSTGPSELYAHAALANRQAASTGRSHCFYVPEMSERLTRRLQIARDLDGAIGSSDLELYYQPKVDLTTGRLTGAEALLRWTHSQHGSIPMDDLIPVAEERGLMPKLGFWIMAEACRQVASWRAAGTPIPGRLAVNVSAKQLDSPDFVSRLAEVVTSARCSSEAVEIELTETALLSNRRQAFAALHELDRAGFSLAIDDFGKGYSSLSYLSGFPAAKLKIDMAFVKNMLDSPKDLTIVKTIVGMADNLGVTTVAEGVETDEQVTALQQLGCTEAQGFFFGKPESAKHFAERWLSRRCLN